MDFKVTHTSFIDPSLANRRSELVQRVYPNTGPTSEASQAGDSSESKDDAYSVSISDAGRERAKTSSFGRKQQHAANSFNRNQRVEESTFERQQQLEKADFLRKQQLEASAFRRKRIAV